MKISMRDSITNLVFFITLIIIGLTGLSAQVVSAHEASKFKTVFTITFNEMTLEDAARMETVIKEKFKDACKIEVELGEADTEIESSDATDVIIIPWDESWDDEAGGTITAPGVEGDFLTFPDIIPDHIDIDAGTDTINGLDTTGIITFPNDADIAANEHGGFDVHVK